MDFGLTQSSMLMKSLFIIFLFYELSLVARQRDKKLDDLQYHAFK